MLTSHPACKQGWTKHFQAVDRYIEEWHRGNVSGAALYSWTMYAVTVLNLLFYISVANSVFVHVLLDVYAVLGVQRLSIINATRRSGFNYQFCENSNP